MSKYGQELRVFVACCPGGGKISQKLMKKINEAADKFDTLEQQRDDLLAALERIYECGSIKKAEQIAHQAIAKAKK